MVVGDGRNRFLGKNWSQNKFYITITLGKPSSHQRVLKCGSWDRSYLKYDGGKRYTATLHGSKRLPAYSRSCQIPIESLSDHTNQVSKCLSKLVLAANVHEMILVPNGISYVSCKQITKEDARHIQPSRLLSTHNEYWFSTHAYIPKCRECSILAHQTTYKILVEVPCFDGCSFYHKTCWCACVEIELLSY